MSDRIWTPRDIIAWGSQQFPNATEDGLGAKLRDEVAEWIEDGDPKELCDIYIVVVQLLSMQFGGWASAQEAVSQKMSTNASRRWRINDQGVGQHVEGT